MIDKSQFYEFTNISGLNISGKSFVQQISPTHEQCAFINEIVRTAEARGNFEPTLPYYTSSNNAARDNIKSIMPNIEFLRNRVNRLNEQISKPYIDVFSHALHGTWSEIDELNIQHNSTCWSAGNLYSADVNKRLKLATISSDDVIDFPSLIMPSRDDLTIFKRQIFKAQQLLYRSAHGYLSHFDNLFTNPKWTRSDGKLIEPEKDINDAGVRPFLSIKLHNSYEINHAASLYYRVVWNGIDYDGTQKNVDYTYSREYDDFAFSAPARYWVYPKEQETTGSFIYVGILFAVIHCAIWQRRSGYGSRLIALDDASNVRYVYPTSRTGGSLFAPITIQNGISWLFDGMSVAEACDKIATYAGAKDLPATKAYSEDDYPYDKIGYQVYVEPRYYVTQACRPFRSVSNE